MVTYKQNKPLNVYKLTNVKTGEVIIGTKYELPEGFVDTTIRTTISRNGLYKGLYKCEILNKQNIEYEVNRPTPKYTEEKHEEVKQTVMEINKICSKPIVKGSNDIDTYAQKASVLGLNYGEYVAMKDGYISERSLCESHKDGHSYVAC